MAWSSSHRRQRLPANWEAIRQKVKARARGRCEALTHVADCDGIGTDCDHIDQGDDHRLSNLRWLSGPCHDAKTQAEAREAQGMVKGSPLPRERHPGAR